MNVHLKEAFSRMKPVCDMVMINPSPAYILEFESLVNELKVDVLQELHQYMLFPFITHLQSKEIESKYDMQRILVNGMKVVIQRVKVTSYEMCVKIEIAYMNLIFDKTKPGMVANVPEELKLSVVECLTALMINLVPAIRLKVLQTQVPLLAQAVFLSVHLAKLEKLRSLRIASIECLNAHIACHKLLTDDKGRLTDPTLEKAIVNMTSTILPGVLAALQDVATCAENPGHAVIVAALDATHRILCLTMNDKHFKKKKEITADDLINMLKSKDFEDDEVKKEKKLKSIAKLSREWYSMAGDKLRSVMKSLVVLVTHEHYRVRKELAVLCHRILTECSETMQQSLPLCIEVLICLSSDHYTEVSKYCSDAVTEYFSRNAGVEAMESLCENFLLAINNLPRVLNNIDSNRKLSALNSVLGYVRVLVTSESQWTARPLHLRPTALTMERLRPAALALLAAAALQAPPALLTRHATRDVSAAPPADEPWCVLLHLEGEGPARLREVCGALGELASAPLLLDLLLDELQAGALEPLCLVTWIATAPNAPPALARRLIIEYMQEELWEGPRETDAEELPGPDETYDVTVYDPRAWTKDSVPGLYEGATETRYTDVSYLTPRRPRTRASLAEARRGLLRRCLLAHGLGQAARRLGAHYQPYLLRTLCPVLQTVGSKYEMLHLAGLKALNDMAFAFDHTSVADLIAENADYCTSQITNKLKKAWSIPAALQMLSVVMEYSDVAILDYLYGIVDDVLVQSCDRYYQQDLYSFLMVFLTFVTRIRQWFPEEQQNTDETPEKIDVLNDVMEYIKNQKQAEKLLEMEEFEKESGKSAEEMYREDVKKREEEMMDYDDTVAEEAKPVPQHVRVTVSVVRRCIQFVPAAERDHSLLALGVLARALPLLAPHPDELLPLVHRTWAALVGRFHSEPPVLRRCLELLVVLAALAKDFIRSRTVKEVLPSLYKFLHKSSADSYLKDAGSSYRLSQAFSLQLAILEALPTLVSDLKLDEDTLSQAMDCTQLYLSKKQPKPLQELAVKSFKKFLEYNYGATWQHLRCLCNNQALLQPPAAAVALEPVLGTPYEASDTDYDANVKLIFDINN